MSGRIDDIIKQINPDAKPVLYGAVGAWDAVCVAALYRRFKRQLLWIVATEERLSVTRTALTFFAPKLSVTVIPAWDTLPFDRASPGADIAGARADALAVAKSADVVLVSAYGFIQKVPQHKFFNTRMLSLAKGQPVSQDYVTGFLTENGYTAVSEVFEPMDFSIRGGLVDLYPPSLDSPVRLDWFGDQLESIKPFDVDTQTTVKGAAGIDRLTIGVGKEFLLDPAGIENFRRSYRELVGGACADDAMYGAVSDGRHYVGCENWLPFFHEQPLISIYDFLDCPLTIADFGLEQAMRLRADEVADHYAARKQAADPNYVPLPHELLYQTPDDYKRVFDDPHVMLDPLVGEDGADCGGRVGRSFNAGGDLAAQVNGYIGDIQTIFACYSQASKSRLEGLFPVHKAHILNIERGFKSPDLIMITEQDLWGERLARTIKKRRRADRVIAEITALNIGDLVVHIDHGIGRYDGLANIMGHDFIRIIYAENSRLMIPVENLDVISRYSAADEGAALDKIGGQAWEKRKKRTKAKVMEIAADLLKTQGLRDLKSAPKVFVPEGLYDEFCARFPYTETDDQAMAINDVIGDFASGKPMDRLVCGDVGFGKTEVAMRAAFLAAASGLQVAVIVPTTLLAGQHYQTFSARFKGFPVKIGRLSRLVGAKEAKQAKVDLKDGSVDIVIGTHALLAKDVDFSNLGLVIIDEEQRFGVAHKERLKALKTDIHILTLTATPIPRTLQMSLVGVRQLSMITTPPLDRMAVRTFISPFDSMVIKEALSRELGRSGQVFCVVPRISDMDAMLGKLRELSPHLRIACAHGQMPAMQLEKIMLDFINRKYDALLSTTIIESGLDMPSVNTIIVHRADRFGLAGLYQLRGRIGRGKHRGFAYFTTVPGHALSDTAMRRLEVMQSLDYLGAGFSLANHDMDIRGAGNILGSQQSGHINDVGFELYQQMLHDTIAQLKSDGVAGSVDRQFSPSVNIAVRVMIPESYVCDLKVRMGLYRRIADAQTDADIGALRDELVNRFGKLPPEVENLLEVVGIKLLCKTANIAKLEAGQKGLVISFFGNRFDKPEDLLKYIADQHGWASLKTDHRIVFGQPLPDEDARLSASRRVAADMAAIVSA